MASICGFFFSKYLRNGFTMLEMTSEFDKRFTYVKNDVSMWEMA